MIWGCQWEWLTVQFSIPAKRCSLQKLSQRFTKPGLNFRWQQDEGLWQWSWVMWLLPCLLSPKCIHQLQWSHDLHLQLWLKLVWALGWSGMISLGDDKGWQLPKRKLYPPSWLSYKNNQGDCHISASPGIYPDWPTLSSLGTRTRWSPFSALSAAPQTQ